MLKCTLHHREFGRYHFIKEIYLPVNHKHLIKPISTPGEREDFEVDEDFLLELLPEDFLPVKPKFCLLCVDDKTGGIGLINTKKFRSYAKYFHSYSLSLFNGAIRNKKKGQK